MTKARYSSRMSRRILRTMLPDANSVEGGAGGGREGRTREGGGELASFERKREGARPSTVDSYRAYP